MSYVAVVPLVIYAALTELGTIPHSTWTTVALLAAELVAVTVTAKALRRRYEACYRRQQRVRAGRA